MLVHQGIYLPDGEQHLVEWMTRAGEIVDGRGTYQIKKLRAAMSYVRQHRTAVDIGSHVGLWSMQLAKVFDVVHAFEPVAEHRNCFDLNLAGAAAVVELHPVALGAHDGHVIMHSAPSSSGDTRIANEVAEGGVPLQRLDDYEFYEVDFIKLDCEGYEFNALRGAAATIEQCLPVIIVEQKPGRAQRFGLPETEAVDWLGQKFGYACVREMSGDYIMVPSGAV